MKSKYPFYFLLLLIAIFNSCKENDVKNNRFVLLKPNDIGINFSNTLSENTDLNILSYLYYYNGAGIASGDFNNDGLNDLFFVSNQSDNKLFLNQGDLQFKNSPIPNENTTVTKWSTGVSTVDINADGWLDIYICQIGDFKTIKGKNKLLINLGLDEKGVLQFKEASKDYGLDISSFATQATFFDYDLDGDLDMYLLNHSVYPNRNYGRGIKRRSQDSLAGDRLYRNENGVFIDVSKLAGIYQGSIGYGLGIATSDVNNDHYPDIYITNDFFENDYLYLNNKDGTYKEVIATKTSPISHTTHFSMGIAINDLNNDSFPDILSLDMLPENLETFKASGQEYDFPVYRQRIKNGYSPQYMQNSLQQNIAGRSFSEIAHFSGIAATEWSWAPVIADYDNDGLKDIFISNGIKGATNDLDFISFIANDNIQRRLAKGMSAEDLAMTKEIPEKKVSNYFYKNKNGLQFENTSEKWVEQPKSFSHGAIAVDLDNDGDLEIVTNNVDEAPFIYHNTTDTINHLKLRFKGHQQNTQGIGVKTILYTQDSIQTATNFPTSGYLSTQAPELHFGLNKLKKIDSLKIIWPTGETQIIREVAVNQTLTILYEYANLLNTTHDTPEKVFDTVAPNLPFKHIDYETKDFNISPLTPYAQSNEGPNISVIDFNNDGLQDVFIDGSRRQAPKLLLQQPSGGFEQKECSALENDKLFEDGAHLFFDADNDGDLDLIVATGGNEPEGNKKGGIRYYHNKDNNLIKTTQFETYTTNASTIRSADIDNDGDQDLFIGSNAQYGVYGKASNQLLFKNDGKGNFSLQLNKDLTTLGMVYDAQFSDINKDNYPDLIIAGHYLPIIIFQNDQKGNFIKTENASLAQSNGWWNCIEITDIDQDGDQDIIAGNWGLNSRLSASPEKPLQLYLQDFDNNGRLDPIVTYYYKDIETPIVTKDELAKQIPVINKKYLSYTAFAKAKFSDYFDSNKYTSAEIKKVFTLASTVFENDGANTFKAIPLPIEAQLSSIHSIHKEDIDSDGWIDLILGGNSYDINTQLGRLDASYGLFLKYDQNNGYTITPKSHLEIKGQVRAINTIHIKDKQYFLFGINNDSLQYINAKNILK